MSEKKKQEHLMGIWCEAFECICICDDKAHYYCCCLPSALLCAFVKNNCGYESVNWSAKKRNKNSHMEGKTKMRGKNNKKLNERKNDGESSAKDVLPCVFRNFVKRKSSSFFFCRWCTWHCGGARASPSGPYALIQWYVWFYWMSTGRTGGPGHH